MRICEHCGQDDGTDNKSCYFCGWPGPPLPKASENIRWSGIGDRSPDGRMLESDPQYEILKRAKEKYGAP